MGAGSDLVKSLDTKNQNPKCEEADERGLKCGEAVVARRARERRRGLSHRGIEDWDFRVI
jgi:hypothetical protein